MLDRPVGYFHLFDVQERLEAFLGCKVDLVTPGGLRPELRQGILAAAERIGRYTASLPEDVQAKAPQIPWRKMKGMRNIAFHEYFGIDLSTVWQIATINVPALKSLVQALLAK